MDIDASFLNASITVTRPEGSRGAGGFEQSGTKTVLECRGDVQQGGREFRELRSHYETGDVLVYAEKGVAGVEVGDDVAIEHDSGRTVQASVEATMLDSDALLLSYDG